MLVLLRPIYLISDFLLQLAVKVLPVSDAGIFYYPTLEARFDIWREKAPAGTPYGDSFTIRAGRWELVIGLYRGFPPVSWDRAASWVGTVGITWLAFRGLTT